MLEELKNFRYDTWRKLLNNLINKATIEDVEKEISRIIANSFERIEGYAFIRHIEHGHRLHVTVAEGYYKRYLHDEIPEHEGLIGHSARTKKPYYINGPSMIPHGVIPFGDREITDADSYIIIPLIPDTQILESTNNIKGFVVLHRRNLPFGEKELEIAHDLSLRFGYILDIYNATKLLKDTEKVEMIGETIIHEALGNVSSPNKFYSKHLENMVNAIPSAEGGSLLAETPMGFKIIAIHGFEDYLLNIPPFDKDVILHWYHYGEEDLKRGIPRTLTEKLVREIIKTDKIAQISPKTRQIRSTMTIPIVHDGKIVLFINLDSFSSPVAFNENDIFIAKKLSMYLVSAYSILEEKLRAKQRENIITELHHLSDAMATDSISKTASPQEALENIFIDVLREGKHILSPKWTYIFSDNFEHIESELDEDMERILKEKTLEMLENNQITYTGSNFCLLLIPYTVQTDKHSFTIYVAMARDLPWSDIDISYIKSILSGATVYMKNLSYLRAIYKTQEETLKLLGKALEVRDIETKGHTERTANLTRLLAQKLGFTDIKGIVWGAYLHDIGKLAIPDKILLKPGKLSPEEFEVIKSHVIHGYNLIKHIEGLSETTKNVVLYHHEKWDGSGYVHGLKGEDIPLEARIFAIIDVYDALISERPYKKPWSSDKAIQEIKKGAGSHFDPKVVEAFEEVIKEKNRKDKY
ncbi:HD domain-containing protein [bacterium 3DAC]|nr:HD domain-containing protein [bacterium 3DAC]